MKLKKIKFTILIIIGCFVLLLLLTFIPILSLKTFGMSELHGKYVTVYYEKEKVAAQAILNKLDAKSSYIAQKLGFKQPLHLKIYIYDKQSTFHTKKYGLLTLFFNLDWYIGDNIGTKVLLTSPANPGPAHSYNEIVNQVCVHESVHSYNSVLNSNMPLWMNEGLALYIAGQKPTDFNESTIPSQNDMHTANPITFSNIGGYTYAYLYVQYLDKTYGWNKVVILAKTSNFNMAFSKNESDIYSGWVKYLKNY